MNTPQRLELEELIRSLLHRPDGYKTVDSDAWYSKYEQGSMQPGDEQFSFVDGGQRPVSSILPGVLPFESVTSWRARTLKRMGATGISGNQQRILPLGKLNLRIPGVTSVGGEPALMARLLRGEMPDSTLYCEMDLSRLLFRPAVYWMHTYHRTCPKCLAASRERYGVEYLNAMHSFAFMAICPLHGLQLSSYSTQEIYSYRPQEDFKESKRIEHILHTHKTEAEAYAQFMNTVIEFQEPLNIRHVYDMVLDDRIPVDPTMLKFYRSFSQSTMPFFRFPRSAEALWAQAAVKFITFQAFLAHCPGKET